MTHETTDCSTPLAAEGTLPVLAAGRDCTIFALGTDRVLRKSFDGCSMQLEADAMNHARAAGFPVPRVYDIGHGELELDRIDGPTMLQDLLEHPWRLGQHARLLASLHRRLQTITAPDDMRPGPVPGDAMVHLDLHPGNVMLGSRGPAVIDWTHAARGAGASDIALTWTSLACFDHDATGLRGRVATRFRAAFLDCFLRTAGRAQAAAAAGHGRLQARPPWTRRQHPPARTRRADPNGGGRPTAGTCDRSPCRRRFPLGTSLAAGLSGAPAP